MAKDVVDLIIADHREVERLFEVLKNDPSQRPLVLPQVTALLVAHSRAEEAEVYPVARHEAGEADEVAHSQEEHVQAEGVLAKLAAMEPTDQSYASTLKELIGAVSHHVEEEETSVLPGLRTHLDGRRLAELADAFAASRAEHLGDRPGAASHDELYQQAANAEVEGRSSMTKDELKRHLDS